MARARWCAPHLYGAKVSRSNHVILTGVSFNYRDMLMNFVCNIRRLGIYDQVTQCARRLAPVPVSFGCGTQGEAHSISKRIDIEREPRF